MRTIAHQIEKRAEKRGMETKAIAIAKNMIRDKESIEKIMKWTGLSAHAIERLEQESK